MCLVSLKQVPEIAEKEIVVYKILKEDYESPYYKTGKEDGDEYCYEIKYYYKPGINIAKGSVSIEPLLFRYHKNEEEDVEFCVGSGFLHAYTNLNVAIEHAMNLGRDYCKLYVFKMVIPKGTEYFTSKNNSEICSKKLFFEELNPMFVHIPTQR